MEVNLKGKTALIGGSSKGLGKACALSLAKEGVNIVLCARGEEALQETKKEIESLGVDVLALSGDMSDEAYNRRVVQEATDRFGGIPSKSLGRIQLSATLCRLTKRSAPR